MNRGAALMLLLTACQDPSAPKGPAVVSLSLTPLADTFAVLGDTARWSATALDAGHNPIPDVPVTWSSSDTGVAKVSSRGLVIAAGNGEASVTATAGQVRANGRVVVRQALNDVRLAPAQWSFPSVGDTVRLTPTFFDARGRPMPQTSITWSSSDATVATVNAAGLVTARANGIARIVASDGLVQGSSDIVVLQRAVTIAVTPARDTLAALQETLPLRAVARDARGNLISGRMKLVRWSFAGDSAIAVDATGLVRAIAPGTTIVAATLDNVRGTSIIVVNPLPAKLAFISDPRNTVINAGLDTLRVAIEDFLGNVVTRSHLTVSIGLEGNSTAATLNGTLTADPVNGVARFPNLSVTASITGARLVASASALPSATGAPFTIAELHFTGIAAASNKTCGTMADGAVYCWGSGFLGDGSLNLASAIPIAIAADPVFDSLSIGSGHACARTSGNGLSCWGWADQGQLGVPPATLPHFGDFGPQYSNVPLTLSAASPFTAVTVGYRHSCALVTSGAAYCWGNDLEGQLGDSDFHSGSRSSTPAAVSGGHAFTHLSSGGDHTCGIDGSGNAWCWGTNPSGEIGNGLSGSSQAEITPVAVTGGHQFEQITAGASHTCALDTGGAAWCWGNNGAGQLGDGTTTQSSVAVAVTGGHVFATISAGEQHTCGVVAGGAAWCWGLNDSGQLGVAGGMQSAPVEVGGGIVFQHITAGSGHTCGLSSARVAYCWGSNVSGILGDGTLTAHVMPTRVVGQP